MLKIGFLAFTIISLTGCATAPQPLAWWFDWQDPCQVELSKMPDFCGASNGRVYAYKRNGDIYYYNK